MGTSAYHAGDGRAQGRIALNPEKIANQGERRWRDSALTTAAGVLLGLAVVSTFVWWVVVLSPVGLAGRFENTTGGGELRTLLNELFRVATGVLLAAGLGAAALSWWHRGRR